MAIGVKANGVEASALKANAVKASLPQHAADKAVRIAGLKVKQDTYKYQYRPEFLQEEPSLENVKFPCAEKVPPEEGFSTKYIVERLAATAPMFINNRLMKVRRPFDPVDKLEDYDDVFMRLRKPPQIMDKVFDDDMFAEQRLSGANPMRITVLKSDDSRARILEDIADERLRNLGKERLQAGQLFVTDYTGRDPTYTSCLNAEGGTAEFDNEEIPKYLPKPIAFFYWDTTGDRLMPLAIQVTENGRVFLPGDGGPTGGDPDSGKEPRDDWLFAKLCVQIADGNHHEMIAHLALHFIFEPIAISTQRQLHENHPLNLLLKTHMRFFLMNNNVAHSSLVSRGGTVDQLMAATRPDMLGICYEGVRSWDMKKSWFAEDIKARGLDDPAVLPKYPYRDDGMRVWQVIHKTVCDYLGCFYDSDQAVKDDHELQAWAQELSATPENGGGWVGGFPSRFETLDELVQIVAIVIMHVGPVHAAVNYLQYEYMSLVSNMPMAAFADPEKLAAKPEISRQDLLSFLPPFELLSVQVDSMFFLSAYFYDELGEYKQSYKQLYDSNLDDVFENYPQAAGVLKSFKPMLDTVESEIDADNESRDIKYYGMLPSKITNSTSI